MPEGRRSGSVGWRAGPEWPAESASSKMPSARIAEDYSAYPAVLPFSPLGMENECRRSLTPVLLPRDCRGQRMVLAQLISAKGLVAEVQASICA